MNLFFHHKDTKAQRKSKKGKVLLLSFQVLFLSVSLCLCGKSLYAQETITVAVASSLYGNMQHQVAKFEKNHDVTVRLISGSTGRLYNQIIQGAPFDVFIAADEQRPAMLAKLGKVIEAQQVGQGYLGLMIGHRVVVDSAVLSDASIRHIAIANPDVAPFGQATKKVLQQQGLWQKLNHKFVYAQNAMQAKMMVDKGLVDAGFVPVSSDNAFMTTLPYVGVLLIDKLQAHTFMQTIKQKYLRHL
ncbi:MAG: molybdate ABC transporter substrate-binding protein [Mariprofundus sp.]|nr:molybdate ABC transporter substrate-binding protein [Mariprofundus sp.]